MNKMLLVVDPQYDFISGSLAVPGAADAMNGLAEHIKNNSSAYAIKVLTSDWHPAGHVSFSENGGQWPAHCVAKSKGAAIWEFLLAACLSTSGHTEILYKGEQAEREEYSIFGNDQSSARIGELLAQNAIEQIDLCGIAGDICVLETLKDGIRLYGPEKFHVLERFSPSLDGGAALNAFCRERLSCARS